jgi:hypothetical protein
MLPAITDPRWESLVRGTLKHHFALLGSGMLIARLARETVRDPSEQNVKKCVEEAYAYFQKYEAVSEDDLNAIFTKGGN